ncbi:HAD family hydrolase [Candidatus Giovannonibacteria bacterium]|nr:HAD family hydrolase [Candidatus Giovannonibacteria bacterium]
MIKSVIFDFDGTLVNSEGIKRRAYFEIFRDFPGSDEIVENFLSSHERIPRAEAIRGILEKFGKDGIDEYLVRYGDYVEEKIINHGEIGGSEAVLEALSKDFPLYLNSGTPQASLENVIERKKWNKYFKGIYGAPPGTKAENYKNILSSENIDGGSAVIIGDGDDDKQIASQHGSNFIHASKLLDLSDIIKKL